MAARAADAFERLLAFDPSLQRLRAAARALLTAALGAAVLLPLARLLHVRSNVALIGVVVPLMTAVALQDATPAQQRRTLRLAPLVAVPVVLLGALTADSALLGGAGFVAVIFAGMIARRFGPRAAGLGMLAWMAYFYAQLLEPPLATIGWIAAAVAVGTGIGWLVRLPFAETPRRLLRSELRAYRARTSVLLRGLARSLAGHPRAERRAARDLAQLNALSLQLDDRLVQFATGDTQDEDAVRERLLDVELAAETLVSTTAAARAMGGGNAALLQALVALRASVRDGAPYDADSIEMAARQAGEALDPGLEWRLRHAAQALATRTPWTLPLPELAEAPHPPPSPREPPPRRWYALDENLRRACQAAAAASGAVVVGHAISPDHWFWAVFASFLVFTRASNMGQALSQAWQGVLANVAGVAFGLALADAVHGHATLQLALLFTFVAAGFYAFPGPVYTLLLTAMLAMLYELLGQHTPDLLLTRLLETVAGAVMAVASGLLVFPVRTQVHSDRESAALLREAAALLRGAFDPPPDLDHARDAVRALDRRLLAVRRTLGPVTQASYPAPKEPHRRRLHRISVLVYCVRHLVHLVAEYPRDFAAVPALAALAREVAGEAERVAAQVEHGAVAPAQRAAGDEVPDRDDNEHRRTARHWLLRARRLVGEIAEA